MKKSNKSLPPHLNSLCVILLLSAVQHFLRDTGKERKVFCFRTDRKASSIFLEKKNEIWCARGIHKRGVAIFCPASGEAYIFRNVCISSGVFEIWRAREGRKYVAFCFLSVRSLLSNPLSWSNARVRTDILYVLHAHSTSSLNFRPPPPPPKKRETGYVHTQPLYVLLYTWPFVVLLCPMYSTKLFCAINHR